MCKHGDQIEGSTPSEVSLYMLTATKTPTDYQEKGAHQFTLTFEF
jgi:hypothetical protein